MRELCALVPARISREQPDTHLVTKSYERGVGDHLRRMRPTGQPKHTIVQRGRLLERARAGDHDAFREQTDPDRWCSAWTASASAA
jgi:hypothetical protein